jgi:SAM-dependent methyltransferase
MPDDAPDYLRPYLDAARAHGEGFRSLLWASPRTQAVRFDALTRIVDFRGRLVCDVGCGRADLLDHLDRSGIPVADYTGIEAVPELAAAAGRKRRAGVRVLRGDFVRDPVRMFVGAEVVAFSGSLNTADDPTFYATVRRAFDATAGRWRSTSSAPPRWPARATCTGGRGTTSSGSSGPSTQSRCG